MPAPAPAAPPPTFDRPRRALVVALVDLDRQLARLAYRSENLGYAAVALALQTSRAIVIDALAELEEPSAPVLQ